MLRQMIKILFLLLFFLVSCTEKKNINEILIHQSIDDHFSKKEIKRYLEDIGIPEPQRVLNIEDNIFTRNFDVVQIIFNNDNREIYSINGIYFVNPDKCLKLREEKINDFKIFTNITSDFTNYADEEDYEISAFDRKVSKIGYFHNNEEYYISLTCYDNRGAYMPNGKTFKVDGELRYEIISDKYKLQE